MQVQSATVSAGVGWVAIWAMGRLSTGFVAGSMQRLLCFWLQLNLKLAHVTLACLPNWCCQLYKRANTQVAADNRSTCLLRTLPQGPMLSKGQRSVYKTDCLVVDVPVMKLAPLQNATRQILGLVHEAVGPVLKGDPRRLGSLCIHVQLANAFVMLHGAM